jgi:hypothetical protein
MLEVARTDRQTGSGRDAYRGKQAGKDRGSQGKVGRQAGKQTGIQKQAGMQAIIDAGQAGSGRDKEAGLQTAHTQAQSRRRQPGRSRQQACRQAGRQAAK